MAAAVDIDRVLGKLECPVCLLIPREGPVGACSVGHIVCKDCKVNVDTCPTCRREMRRTNTNTVVNQIIDEIPHPCKYGQFGCEIKQRLNKLKEHESKCPERTIKCPYLKCKEEVQIKGYHLHHHALISHRHRVHDIYVDGEFFRSLLTQNAYFFMKSFEKSGRGNLAGNMRLRVDMTEKVEMCVDCQRYFVSNDSLQKHLQEVHKVPGPKNDVSIRSSSSLSKKKSGDFFYLHQYYFSSEKAFAFYVTGEAEKNLVKITVKNFNDKRKFLTNVQSVVSMDSAPRDKEEVLASNSVMFVPWKQMRGFLKWTGKDGRQSSRIQVTVEIIDG